MEKKIKIHWAENRQIRQKKDKQKSGDLTITFGEFAKILWKAQRGIHKKDMFVSSIFTEAGNEYFLTTDINVKNDLGYKIMNGTRRLTEDKRTVGNPFPREKMKLFFINHLHNLKFHILYNEFGILATQEKDNDLLIDAIVEVFRNYTLMDEEDVTITVKEEYERLYTLPKSRTLVSVDRTEFYLVNEMGSICPLTGEKLIIIHNNEKFTNYCITQIFPSHLTPLEESIFTKYKTKPTNLDSVENLIAISPRASFDYYKNKSIDVFKYLLNEKEQALKRAQMKTRLDSRDIEQGVSEVINALVDVDFDNLADLSYTAFSISDKIPDNQHATTLLVKTYVLKYYNFINEYLSYMDIKQPGVSSRIAGDMKWLSDHYMAYGLSPMEVIEKLANIILNKTGLPLDVLDFSRVIICYFVQHCEVLSHEIS